MIWLRFCLLLPSMMKTPLAARSLQRLDDALALVLFQERLHLVRLARDAGGGAHLLREVLEIGLVHGIGQMLGIVEHDDPVAGRDLREQQSRGRRPVALAQLFGRVRAQHEDVVILHADALRRVLAVVDMLEIVGVVLELLLLAQRGHGADRLLGIVDEIAQSDQRHLMPQRAGFARQPDGGVIVLLGLDLVDGKCDFHDSELSWYNCVMSSVRTRSSRFIASRLSR